MSEVNREARSTIILFIAILIAVVITVWIILSFDKPISQDKTQNQSSLLFQGHQNYDIALQTEDNFI